MCFNSKIDRVMAAANKIQRENGAGRYIFIQEGLKKGNRWVILIDTEAHLIVDGSRRTDRQLAVQYGLNYDTI